MEQLLAFVNIADYILHCTQINSFELGNSTRKRFDEKRQSCFSRQKFTL